MRHEKNPAVPAPGQARSYVGMGPKGDPQSDVVPQDQIPHLVLTVPPGVERKKRLDFYEKKTSVSLRMVICLCMLSLYQPATSMSRG